MTTPGEQEGPQSGSADTGSEVTPVNPVAGDLTEQGALLPDILGDTAKKPGFDLIGTYLELTEQQRLRGDADDSSLAGMPVGEERSGTYHDFDNTGIPRIIARYRAELALDGLYGPLFPPPDYGAVLRKNIGKLWLAGSRDTEADSSDDGSGTEPEILEGPIVEDPGPLRTNEWYQSPGHYQDPYFFDTWPSYERNIGPRHSETDISNYRYPTLSNDERIIPLRERPLDEHIFPLWTSDREAVLPEKHSLGLGRELISNMPARQEYEIPLQSEFQLRHREDLGEFFKAIRRMKNQPIGEQTSDDGDPEPDSNQTAS